MVLGHRPKSDLSPGRELGDRVVEASSREQSVQEQGHREEGQFQGGGHRGLQTVRDLSLQMSRRIHVHCSRSGIGWTSWYRSNSQGAEIFHSVHDGSNTF